MPPLTTSELNHLFNFVGYGNPAADVWWLGMEEGMSQDDVLEENLRSRLKFNPIEDLRDACLRNGVTKYHEGRRVSQSTWWVMCEVMLGLAGEETDRESKRAYQAERLGRHEGETLLLKLMPLPKPRIGSWDYQELIPQYTSRDHYYESVLPDRAALIRSLITEHRPRLVIAYGKGFWDRYKQLFADTDFENVPESKVFQIGQGQTNVILSPHPTSWDINGQVSALTELARSHIQAN